MEQSVTLAGFGCQAFEKGVHRLQYLSEILARNFPEGVMKSWNPFTVTGYGFPAIRIANRYLLHDNDVGDTPLALLNNEIDPLRILRKGCMNGGYQHTIENQVQYFGFSRDEDTNKARWVV